MRGRLIHGLGFSVPLLATWLCVMPAHAQVDSREGIALQNQIYELRQEVQALRQQLGQSGGSNLGRAPYQAPASGGGDMVAQLLTRVDGLEDQVRQLRGRLDETQNQLQRQTADLSKRIDDLAFQLNPQAVPAPGGTPPGAVPPTASALPPLATPGLAPIPLTNNPPPPPPQLPTGPVKRTPELAMQEGNAALARHDYPAAEQAAREVLNNFKTSPRAYDAQFLMAEALAGERQYPQAAIAYDDAYNRTRKGAHAPDALLGLATSLTAINEKKAACDTLAKLRSEFPQLRPEARDSAAATAQRAGCR